MKFTNKFALTALAVAVTAALGGCGGGSSSGTAATVSGTFVNSEIGNADFTCAPSGVNGTTSSDPASKGQFDCEATDTDVVFSIGGLTFPSVAIPASGVVHVTDLSADAGQVERISRFLQTIDADGLYDNGIEVRDNTKTELAGADFATLFGSTFETAFGALGLTDAGGAALTLVDADDALANLDQSKSEHVGPVSKTESTFKIANITKYTVDTSAFDVAYNGKFAAAFPFGFKLGIGSGLRVKEEAANAVYLYGLTDRGANGDGPKSVTDPSGETASKVFPTPDYAPQFGVIKVTDTAAVLTEVTTLKSAANTPISGRPIALGSTGATGERALDEDLNGGLAFDPNGQDPEGIDIDADGNLWIVDEYGPFLSKVDPTTGVILQRLAPGAGLPDSLALRKANRGMEAIAITPNGKIYGVVQSPLDGDGRENYLRVVEYDPSSGTSRMLAYPHDREMFKDKAVKIGDMVAVDNNRFVIIEQGSDVNGNLQNVVYLVDIRGAEALPDVFQEALTVKPAMKTFLFNLRDFGWRPDKAEGIALLSDMKTLVFINDNDFGMSSGATNYDATKKDADNIEDGYALTLDANGNLTGVTYTDDDSDASAMQYTINNTGVETQLWMVELDRPLTEISGANVQFANAPVPVDADTKTEITAAPQVLVGNTQQDLSYTKLMATGDTDNGEIFGLSKDVNGNPITFADSSNYICNGTNDGVGSGLDFTSMLQTNGKLYMVSQFECQVGSMYAMELNQAIDGTITPVAGTLQFVDQSEHFGGFVHCAGQVTPWQTHLGSEEYEPNARAVEANADPVTGLTGDKYYDEVAKYWPDGMGEPDITQANPYFYGWTPEVTIDATGTAIYNKHYAMGRFAHELSYVMPDQKTVYASDDGTNGGFYRYVADTAGDLSSGTLYVAKWNQTSADNGGAANLGWISLGHADNASVRAFIDTKPAFSDIFDTIAPQADGSCADAAYTSVNTTFGNECLKLRDVNGDMAIDATDAMLASRLETRRYAGMLGGTTEFRKMEGITFNRSASKLYLVMSEVAYGMEDNAKKGSANTGYDKGTANDIRLPYNPCGAVYEMDVDGSYTATNAQALITGMPRSYPTGHIYEGNSCDVNGISNPDNASYMGDNILLIGEDTGAHLNNMVWAYNTETGTLNRIFTTPLDAESTSLYNYDINGYRYIMSVTQHPMGDQAGASDSEKESQAGYIGPFTLD